MKWAPLLALGLFITGNLVVFVADLHIIWVRNTPAKYQLMASAGKLWYTGLKVAVCGGVPLVGVMEIVTRVSVIEPNALTNAWRCQPPFGPKFGYANQGVRARHYLMAAVPKYDPVVYGGKSGVITHHKLNVAVKMNLSYIHKEFNLAYQQGVQAPMKLPLTLYKPLNLSLDSPEFKDLLNLEDNKG